MSDLIVIGFDHLEDARTALKELRSIEKEGRIAFEDTAIVERDADGNAHVRNEVSGTTETAAVVGAVIGGFVTFVFPPVGMAIGAAAGAAVGAAMGRGVSGDFVKEVEAKLPPGRSALFLVVKSMDDDATMAAFRDFRGDLIQSTLPTEEEDAIRETLHSSGGHS
jgi:uncharacterized membrane protein